MTPPGPYYRNATVNYTITGTNFQPGNTEVTFRNASGSALNETSGAGVWLVTPTKIYGSVVVPYSASSVGAWNSSVSTFDGGTVWKPAAFAVARFPAPTITSITPVSGFRNSTVSYTLVGTNFQPGLTTVDLSTPASGELNTTIYSITSTRIIGGISFPSDAPTVAWKLNVTTLDGGKVSRAAAFTVNKVLPPAITTFAPATGYRGTTVSYIVNGNYFQPGGRTTVNLSQPGADEIQTTISSVYSSRIYGTVTIPSDAATGSWKVNVSTVDGGNRTLINAIRIY
jgi:hypothetical protein